MEVTFKKLAKCVFKSGRQALVREMLEEELNRGKILEYASTGVAYGINKGINAVPQAKRATLHTALECAHNATGRLIAVTDPTSPGGMTVTPDEARLINQDLGLLTENVFTDATVKLIHEKILEKVP